MGQVHGCTLGCVGSGRDCWMDCKTHCSTELSAGQKPRPKALSPKPKVQSPKPRSPEPRAQGPEPQSPGPQGQGHRARGQGQGRARCSLRALRLRGQLQRCWLCHGVARRHCRLHRRARHLARRRRLWHHRRVQWDGRQAGGDGLAAGAMLGKGFLRSMGLLQRGKQHPGLPGAGGGRRRERLRRRASQRLRRRASQTLSG